MILEVLLSSLLQAQPVVEVVEQVIVRDSAVVVEEVVVAVMVD